MTSNTTTPSDYSTQQDTNWVMDRGKYRGKPLSEVPVNYLEWMYRAANVPADLRGAIRQEGLRRFDAKPNDTGEGAQR